MARPKSACGTYSAYQRHLREKTPVDAACQRAQRVHDAEVSATRRGRDVGSPLVQAVPTTLEKLRQREGEIRSGFLVKVTELTAHVEERWLYGVIDVTGAMDEMLDEWCNVRDDIDYERGYPELSPELRAQVLAAREADDGDETP
jgi:hypothetical protein